jgi:hypothetical protein
MPGAQGNECRACLSIHHKVMECDYLPFLINRDLECGCKPEELKLKDTSMVANHCCKCKKQTPIYKMNEYYNCKDCQRESGIRYPTMIASQLRKNMGYILKLLNHSRKLVTIVKELKHHGIHVQNKGIRPLCVQNVPLKKKIQIDTDQSQQ